MNTYALSYRKTYKLKRQTILVLALFAAVIIGILISSNLLQEHQAQASNAYEEVIHYKSIEIESGDTLWTIADRYMGSEFKDKDSYIKEIQRLNHLSDDKIQAGGFLIVPYTDTSVSFE